jgi:hypothetical protein
MAATEQWEKTSKIILLYLCLNIAFSIIKNQTVFKKSALPVTLLFQNESLN